MKATRAVDLDSSLSHGAGYYLKTGFQKTEHIESTLESSIYLFLSIVYGSRRMSEIFRQRCDNKDRFLSLLDCRLYEKLLHQVLQVINQYFSDCRHQDLGSFASAQKTFESQLLESNTSKLQRSIKQIVAKDLNPLKNLILKTQEQTESWKQELRINKSGGPADSILEKSQKASRISGVEQLKQKIQNLAMQHEISLQCRLIKTEKSAKRERLHSKQDKTVQTTDFLERQRQPQNRISFGNQALLQTLHQHLNDNSLRLNSHLIQGSPTFSKEVEAANKRDKVEEQEYMSKRKRELREGTFGKIQSEKKFRKSRTRSDHSDGSEPSYRDSSRSTPRGIKERDLANYDKRLLSIDQQEKKKRNPLSGREFNIITNEKISHTLNEQQ